MMYLFGFERAGVDTINNNGKITSYAQIFVCSDTEENARTKAKMSDEYKLKSTPKQLNEDWQK